MGSPLNKRRRGDTGASKASYSASGIASARARFAGSWPRPGSRPHRAGGNATRPATSRDAQLTLSGGEVELGVGRVPAGVYRPVWAVSRPDFTAAANAW